MADNEDDTEALADADGGNEKMLALMLVKQKLTSFA